MVAGPVCTERRRTTQPTFGNVVNALRSTTVFRELSEGAVQRIAQIAHPHTYSAGQAVFRAGDASDSLLVVHTGRMAVCSLSPEGGEVILNLIDPTQAVGEIGLIDGGPRTAHVRAVRDSRALLLMRRDFLPILESEPSAMLAMVHLVCARLRQTTSFVADAVLEGLPVRLLRRIQALARSYGRVEPGGSGLRIEHGLSQQELGHSIGVSRVSVSKQLGVWRARGLLDLGRGFIVVHDMRRLEAAVHG
jgi:CRP-like cAMP-binding protein